MGAVLMSEIKVFAKDYPMAPIDKFIPYANNARTHSKEQINKLRSIYRGIGYGDPVEVDENFTILSGHGRVEAAKAEGMTELPYVMLTGMTESEKKAYILAVNRSALDAGWDEDLLAVEIEALQEQAFDLSCRSRPLTCRSPAFPMRSFRPCTAATRRNRTMMISTSLPRWRRQPLWNPATSGPWADTGSCAVMPPRLRMSKSSWTVNAPT